MEENQREENYQFKIINKSKRIQTRLQLEYNIKDKEVKKSARHDTRAQVDNIAMKVETSADGEEMSTVYRLTNNSADTPRQVLSRTKGNPRTTEETQAKRWIEHFSEFLNRESVTITADPTPNDDLDIATGAPTPKKLDRLYNKRSPELTTSAQKCSRQTYILQAGSSLTSLEKYGQIMLYPLIGIRVQSKKEDLQHCINWRGITLLSVPSKIFCRYRINRAIGVKLRHE